MSYLHVGLNDTTIYPFNRTRYQETVVRNMDSAAHYYGFLGDHGKRLNAYGDANKKDYYTESGNLESGLRGIPGRRHKRMLDHYLNALANKLLRVTVNNRDVYYAAVADATAFSVGDLCYWDNSAKLAKPASAFTWNTDLPTTQAGFAAVFLGVCLDNKVGADGQVVLRFDTSPQSAFDFTIASGTAYQIGQSFAPAKDTGNALLANKVAAAVAASSCLRLVADMSNTDTQVLLAPASAYFPVNTQIALG